MNNDNHNNNNKKTYAFYDIYLRYYIIVARTPCASAVRLPYV